VRPTADGVRLLVACAVLFGAGLWLGWPVAELVAGAGIGAVLVGLLTAGRGLAVDVAREVYPIHVPRGEPAIARLQVRNTGSRRSGAFTASDRAGNRNVGVDVPRLAPGEAVLRTYRLPTDRRGRHEVGPLTLVRQDLLGLARTAVASGGSAALWVHPRTHALHVPDAGQSRRFDGPTTDERTRGSLVFRSLREYALGDDMRHVHWKSTARAGQLMVREHVDPDEPQVLVVLDTRTATWPGASFEEGVEVAASVAQAFGARGLRVRILTTTGRAVADAVGDPVRALDGLTEVSCEDAPRQPLRDLVRGDVGGGDLVIVTADAGPDLLGEASRLGARYAQAVVVDLRSSGMRASAGGPLVVAGATAADAVAAWNAAAAGTALAGQAATR
jgi:uncharacterized protein (DUF58 family)